MLIVHRSLESEKFEFAKRSPSQSTSAPFINPLLQQREVTNVKLVSLAPDADTDNQASTDKSSFDTQLFTDYLEDDIDPNAVPEEETNKDPLPAPVLSMIERSPKGLENQGARRMRFFRGSVMGSAKEFVL